MSGLLGEQLFKALDTDEDGLLSSSEFVSGFLTLYRGPPTDVSQLIFAILDFGHKGSITRGDMLCALAYLPSRCPRCGAQTFHKDSLKERVPNCFANSPALPSFFAASLLAYHPPLFTDFLTVFLTALPIVLDRAADFHCSHKTDRSSTGAELSFRPLVWDSKWYLCSLGAACLSAYHSTDIRTARKVVWLGDLFVSPVGDTQFELKNRTVLYLFKAGSKEDRDEWVERIQVEQAFRWFDDYYVTDKVKGLGAYGHVVKAFSRVSGKEVAVKIIDKSVLSLEGEDQLRREISILQFVSHPNVLQLYDVFETFERIYIVTELIDGGTLFEHLEGRKFRVTEEFARKAVSDIAHGLAYLHSNGIVHRDIKLENVMLRSRASKLPQCVIIDFGLSRFLGPTDASEEGVGTLQYAAPEVVLKRKYRTKADCWSLGVILYILLTGEFPFDATNDRALILRILACRLHFSGHKWTAVSPEAVTVTSRLLTFEATERWSVPEVLYSDWLFDDDTSEASDEGTVQIPLKKRTVPSPEGRRREAKGKEQPS